uniref:Uncharacterized protein n=1 Tax=Tanacetum cinerariifolium TaxID=118510 RepID=A0A699KSW4_TANCI|nr:hypothetical protein [Tanacetum cinerariifolium]
MDQKRVEGEELFHGVANRMNKLSGKGKAAIKHQRVADRVLNPSASSRNIRTPEVSNKIGTASSSIHQQGRNNDGVQPRVFENPITYGESRVSKSSKQNVSKDSEGNTQSYIGESVMVNPSRECVIKVEEGAGLVEGNDISVSRMAGNFVCKDPNLEVNNFASTIKAGANDKSYTSLGESTI